MGSFTVNEKCNDQVFVVIPAFNESATITQIVKQVRSLNYNVVVVNDCSTDNTAKLAEQAGAIVLDLSLRLGAWGAIQTGMRYALYMGADIIITLDADGQHNPRDIEKLLNTLNSCVDIVIGSCTQRGSKARKFAWSLFRILTGLKIQDLTSGFRCYTSKAARILIKREGLLFEYQDIGILLLARKKGFIIKELDVHMLPRQIGASHIFSSWFKVAYYMFCTILISITRR